MTINKAAAIAGFAVLFAIAGVSFLYPQAPSPAPSPASVAVTPSAAEAEAVTPDQAAASHPDQPRPAAPTKVVAADTPDDAGDALTLTWEYPENVPVPAMFVIYRATDDGEFEKVKETRAVHLRKFDDGGLEKSKTYRYRVDAVIDSATAASAPSLRTAPRAQWFRWDRRIILFTLIFLLAMVVFFIWRARSGANLFIRKIAGLAAVDEAIGRATEMGKPVLFVPGLGLIDSVSTVAALNLLGEVAKKIIEYRIPLICPQRDPVVYTVAREIVREAYVSAGQPEAFDPDSVFFITQQQFAYAAAVDGIMVRDKPATNFFFGYYYAEALILAETGAATGAIQIAGTDAIAQLPFFITACDYTLIGEELYAASAYLSREPVLMGTLKAQDYGKLALMVLLVFISLMALVFHVDLTWIISAGGTD